MPEQVAMEADAWLHALGARRMLACGLGDDTNGTEEQFQAWSAGLLRTLQGDSTTGSAPAEQPAAAAEPEDASDG